MKKFMMAVAVGLACGFGGAAKASEPCYTTGSGCSAKAGEACYVTKAVTVYECVTVSVHKVVPYECCVTKYDCCGKPYTEHVTRYKTVCVNEVKKVPVVKHVRVPVAPY